MGDDIKFLMYILPVFLGSRKKKNFLTAVATYVSMKLSSIFFKCAKVGISSEMYYFMFY